MLASPAALAAKRYRLHAICRARASTCAWAAGSRGAPGERWPCRAQQNTYKKKSQLMLNLHFDVVIADAFLLFFVVVLFLQCKGHLAQLDYSFKRTTFSAWSQTP